MLGDHLGGSSATCMSGKEINLILNHIGIKSEATRVALHRLKKDGWINTTKVGREVIYQLSKNGLEETNAVYEDVYRENVKYPDGWQLTLIPSLDLVPQEQASNVIMLLKNIFLVPCANKMTNLQCIELEFERDLIPAWFEDRLVPTKTVEIVKQLNLLIQQYLVSPTLSSDLDSITIRLLFLHHWRKMALRDNIWAHIWLCPDGAIAQYHHQVFKVLKLLPRTTE